MFSDSDKSRQCLAGFTLIEILVAISIVSIAFMALATVSVSVIKGNRVSRRSTQSTAMAQSVLEDLKNRIFYLGPDWVLGNDSLGKTDDWGPDNLPDNNWNDGGDDFISGRLVDPDCTYDANNDCVENDDTVFDNNPGTAPLTLAQLFAGPDYDSNGNVNPAITLTRNPQVVWNIRNNAPLDGSKMVLVIAGWDEEGTARYVAMTSVLAGWRYPNAPNTK